MTLIQWKMFVTDTFDPTKHISYIFNLRVHRHICLAVCLSVNEPRSQKL